MIKDHEKPTLTEPQFYEIVNIISDINAEDDDYRTYKIMCRRYGKDRVDGITMAVNEIYLNILREGV
jgi:hypothetical protein